MEAIRLGYYFLPILLFQNIHHNLIYIIHRTTNTKLLEYLQNDDLLLKY